MRMRTKITSGYLLIILAVSAVLIYQGSAIHSLSKANSDLVGTLRVPRVAALMIPDLKDIREAAERLVATEEPRFLESLVTFRESVTNRLARVRVLQNPREEDELRRLREGWEPCQLAALALEERVRSQGFAERGRAGKSAPLSELVQELYGVVDALSEDVRKYLDTLETTAEENAARRRAESQRTERFSRLAALSAAVLTLVVGWFVVRSIHRPLQYLTQATRRIASGRFDYRLAPRGDEELRRLAEDFNDMGRRLAALDDLKNEFLSRVSHDLKGPVASIQETTKLLQEEIPGPLTSEQKRLLVLTLNTAKRLRRMIGDLLDLAGMTAGALRYEFEIVDVGAVARAAADEMRPKLRQPELELDVRTPDAPAAVRCDSQRVSQVLTNLMENAVKFSDRGMQIGLDVEILDQTPEVGAPFRSDVGRVSYPAVCVSVSDQGPGVTDEDKARIFEKFQQVETSQRRKGFGLGLAICRHIVEAHGGAIWVEDAQSSGSIFRVLLPLVPETGGSEKGVPPFGRPG